MSNKKTDKYELLTDSALEMFEKNGFHATKIKDITDNASLAAGTFYLYFKNKEEVLDALLTKYASIILKELEEISNSKLEAIEKIKIHVKANVDFCYNNKSFIRIYFENIPRNENFNPIKHFKEFKQRFIQLTENIISQGIEEKVFKDNINPYLSALCLRGMIIFTVMNSLILDPEKAVPEEEVYEAINLTFLEGIKK